MLTRRLIARSNSCEAVYGAQHGGGFDVDQKVFRDGDGERLPHKAEQVFFPPPLQRSKLEHRRTFVFARKFVKRRQADAEYPGSLGGVHQQRSQIPRRTYRARLRYAILLAFPFLRSNSTTIDGPLNLPSHLGLPPFCAFL